MIVLYISIIISLLSSSIHAQGICYAKGRCEDGYQLVITTTPTYFDCQDACLSNFECNVFTHDQTTDHCELLQDCSRVDPLLCSTCYTGEPDCPKQICSQPGMCQGQPVGEMNSDSEDECLEKCFDNVDCNWYSYDNILEFCLLTSDCDPISSSNFMFGQRECYDASSNPSRKSCSYKINIINLTAEIERILDKTVGCWRVSSILSLC